MGFRENLKAELAYKNLLVKELSALSGVNKRTIDNYLNAHNCMPLADAAVAIAQALGVTVEYLIVGHDEGQENKSSLFPEPRIILKSLEELNKRDRRIVLNLVKSLKEMEEAERQ